MTLRLSNLRLPFDHNDNELLQGIARKLKFPPGEIRDLRLIRKALDARKKHQTISYVYTVDFELGQKGKLEQAEKKLLAKLNNPDLKQIEPMVDPALEPGKVPLGNRPIIVGAGPAGIFAALTLAAYGYKPLVLERGRDAETRNADVERFWQEGNFSPVSNVQFGEGGAGTFSDGKLTTRTHDPRIRRVLEAFVEAGAPEEILYLHKPHIGTDILRQVVQNLRRELINRGGQIRFEAQVTDVIIEKGKVTGVIVNGTAEIRGQAVILATGHSARDIYRLLHKKGAELQAKPLAVGVRVEHPQELIDTAQYGKFAGHAKLGAADYQLVYKNEELSRAAFSFCMCPGGWVVAAASEEGGVVTNGMSNYRRDSGVANSALVVSVSPKDYPGNDPLAGIRFQEEMEHKAYTLGGRDYKAPAQSVGDFLTGKATTDIEDLQLSTYNPGVKPGDLHECLPGYVSTMLEEGLADFGRKIKNFDMPKAVLTGVETRTSAPVRIIRGEDFQSPGIEGLFPCGEGAGYAGGITSAAVDGIRTAEAVITKHMKGAF